MWSLILLLVLTFIFGYQLSIGLSHILVSNPYIDQETTINRIKKFVPLALFGGIMIGFIIFFGYKWHDSTFFIWFLIVYGYTFFDTIKSTKRVREQDKSKVV